MIFHPSKTCPECGSKLSAAADGEDWQCPNPDCPPQVRRCLLHWCSPEAMDIHEADEQLIGLLVGHGLVRDVAEFYRLKLKELVALPGVTPESGQKVFDAITASMKRDGWRLLLGLNIPLVGVAEAQSLAKGFPNVDAMFAAGAARLTREGGVSEAVAQNIVRWYADSVNRKLVRRLEKLGLNFRSTLDRDPPN